MKCALVTDITGQDGLYLVELLVVKGYAVHCLTRWASPIDAERLADLFAHHEKERLNVHVHAGDLSDVMSFIRLLEKLQPDEVYNLVAQSDVRPSFDIPEYVSSLVAMGSLNLLEAVRITCPNARYVQATSCEMYGGTREAPQSETTSFSPRSPYAVANTFAYWMTVNYREAHGLFACNGIMFDHTSPRQSDTFVTRRITRGIAHIIAGHQQKIHLGNADAKRDWGYAKDYVEGVWRILQAQTAGDYVLATGEAHSVREFLNECCKYVGLEASRVVEIDRRYDQPAEVALLVGDASKAHSEHGWVPTTRFHDLVRLMLAADLEALGIDPTRFGLARTLDKAVIQDEPK